MKGGVGGGVSGPMPLGVANLAYTGGKGTPADPGERKGLVDMDGDRWLRALGEAAEVCARVRREANAGSLSSGELMIDSFPKSQSSPLILRLLAMELLPLV